MIAGEPFSLFFFFVLLERGARRGVRARSMFLVRGDPCCREGFGSCDDANAQRKEERRSGGGATAAAAESVLEQEKRPRRKQ